MVVNESYFQVKRPESWDVSSWPREPVNHKVSFSKSKLSRHFDFCIFLISGSKLSNDYIWRGKEKKHIQDSN